MKNKKNTFFFFGSCIDSYNMRGCTESNAFYLLCWPVMSETSVHGMAVENKQSQQYFTKIGCCVTHAAEEQSDKIAYDIELCTK